MRSLWAGGTELSRDETIAVDARRRERHIVNVVLSGRSPFEAPESALFRWTQPMSKGDLITLATTYSSVITMAGDTRDAHLTAMTTYLDGLDEFVGQDVLDVPMRSYCWRAAKRA